MKKAASSKRRPRKKTSIMSTVKWAGTERPENELVEFAMARIYHADAPMFCFDPESGLVAFSIGFARVKGRGFFKERAGLIFATVETCIDALDGQRVETAFDVDLKTSDTAMRKVQLFCRDHYVNADLELSLFRLPDDSFVVLGRLSELVRVEATA